jgi:hypothetical protein
VIKVSRLHQRSVQLLIEIYPDLLIVSEFIQQLLLFFEPALNGLLVLVDLINFLQYGQMYIVLYLEGSYCFLFNALLNLGSNCLTMLFSLLLGCLIRSQQLRKTHQL